MLNLPIDSGRQLQHMSTEILFHISSYLAKSDIKLVRLVNKQFNVISSSLLFDRVYFSPQHKNLEVFRAISQHPIHSKTVKELVYDATWFNPEMNWSKYEYVWRESFNPYLVRQTQPAEIEQGYIQYRKHVEEQYSLIEEELFHLCEGLALMPKVDRVSIRDWWTGQFGDFEEKTCPMSRCCGSLWLEPDSWMQTGYRFEYTTQNPRRQGFLTLMRALSLTRKTVTSFVVSPYDTAYGMSCGIFNLRMTEFAHALNVFSALHKIELYIDSKGFEISARDSLVKLLSAATNLKDLTLSLISHENIEEEDYVDLEEFFETVTWPRLRSFSLHGISIPKGTLLAFLRRHNSPDSRGLKYLSLEFLTLQSGLWVDLVEDMQNSLSLDQADLSGLQDSGEVGYYELCGVSDSRDEDGMRKRLETFILCGGNENPLRKYSRDS
jgi:hypothetical protein